MNRSAPHRFTRRGGLRLFGLTEAAALLAACSQLAPAEPTTVPPTAAPPTQAPAVTTAAKPTAAPAGISDAEWNELIAAARKEDTLNVARYADITSLRGVSHAFQDAFPGIMVERSQFHSSSPDFVPRLPEQNAGLYAWDIATMYMRSDDERPLPEAQETQDIARALFD